MTDRPQLAAEVAASAAAATGASKVTATGAGMAGLGWITNSELIGLADFIVAVFGMLGVRLNGIRCRRNDGYQYVPNPNLFKSNNNFLKTSI